MSYWMQLVVDLALVWITKISYLYLVQRVIVNSETFVQVSFFDNTIPKFIGIDKVFKMIFKHNMHQTIRG